MFDYLFAVRLTDAKRTYLAIGSAVLCAVAAVISYTSLATMIGDRRILLWYNVLDPSSSVSELYTVLIVVNFFVLIGLVYVGFVCLRAINTYSRYADYYWICIAVIVITLAFVLVGMSFIICCLFEGTVNSLYQVSIGCFLDNRHRRLVFILLLLSNPHAIRLSVTVTINCQEIRNVKL